MRTVSRLKGEHTFEHQGREISIVQQGIKKTDKWAILDGPASDLSTGVLRSGLTYRQAALQAKLILEELAK